MFFLLRVAFWLTVVLVLLPTGSPRTDAPAVQVGAVDAVTAASAAVSDVTGFCDRQPEACVVGTQAAVAIGHRAQAGAKMVYEFLHDHMAKTETGSLPEPRRVQVPLPVRAVPAQAGSQTTLRPADLAPRWRGPTARPEAVPLPRPRLDGRHRA